MTELRIGKRLADVVYLHAAALSYLPPELKRIIDQAKGAARANGEWNVVKLCVDESKLSFLWYPRFFEDGFPSLAAATVVDLVTGRTSRRSFGDDNPPVLHRKETLLPPEHPEVAAAAALTREAEEYGLFEQSHDIGHRRAWEARLDRVGLRAEGATLVRRGSQEVGEVVHRHRTALTRYSLSTPMQSLWRHGFLDGDHTVFDYGCGRGDDLRALRSRGLDAAGWDPHFAAEEPLREADVVNLGFVLNVIEDPRERANALLGAWSLARRVLSIGVLIGGRSVYERCRLFRDGVLTARGTFQKYFTTAELRDYVEGCLGREPVALAPGIVFVFRDDVDEQAFLARRASTRSQSVGAPPSQPRPERPARPERVRVAKVRAPNKWEQHADLVAGFWERCHALGRAPEADEFDQSAELRRALGLPQTVLRNLLDQRGSSAFDDARRRRREDLLVFLALNVFERRRSFGSLPEPLRRDVKAHLGGYQSAQSEAQRLLYSAGSVAVIHDACRHAAAAGMGHLDGDHSLQLHSSLAAALPPVLRVYLGCAARLYGDVETADIVKVHIQSGKVSLMMYDDFDGKPLPELIERVKVNLRRQEISFFEYGTNETPTQPLYLKSRYLSPTHPNYAEQMAFDRRLKELGLFDLSGFGPSRVVFDAVLANASMRVVDFGIEVTECESAAAVRGHVGACDRSRDAE